MTIFLYITAEVVFDIMKSAYPELAEAVAFITNVIKNEEIRFLEKYGDRVRVVSLADFSRELCGGTHTAQTGNIGVFKLVSESSVASGVRRIEALTGEAALDYTQQTLKILQETAHLIKENTPAIPGRVKKMLSEIKAYEKEIDQLKTKLASDAGDASPDAIRSIDGIKVMAQKVSVDTPAALRNPADQFKDKIKSGIVVLGSQAGSNAMLIAVVTKDLSDRYHAGNIVKYFQFRLVRVRN